MLLYKFEISSLVIFYSLIMKFSSSSFLLYSFFLSTSHISTQYLTVASLLSVNIATIHYITKYDNIVKDVYLNQGDVIISIIGYGIKSFNIVIGPKSPKKSYLEISVFFNYFLSCFLYNCYY